MGWRIADPDGSMRSPSMKLLFLFIVGSMVASLAPTAKGAPFTLSESAIVALDDTKAEGYFRPPMAATITATRKHAGGGIEMDVHFPSTKNADYSLYLTSNARGGSKKLVGMDVSAFDEYQLKVTILTVDGSKSASPKVTAGALIGPTADGHGYSYKPFHIGLSSTPTAILSSKGFGPKISMLGLMISFYPFQWPEGSHDMTVLVESAPGATPVQPVESTSGDAASSVTGIAK